MDTQKKQLGQFFTTNYEYILQGLTVPPNVSIIEPFAGNCDLLKWKELKNKQIECFDIDSKKNCPDVIKRDTLLNPPDYTGKFVITNPPYLARNKNKDKKIYDKYNLNDLYKCFLKQLIESKPIGGILIIPLNFWCSIRKSDIELRKLFIETFEIIKMNIFEEKVFEDTGYTICSLNFFTGQNGNKKGTLPLTFYPNKNQLNVELTKENNWTIGGELYIKNKSNYKCFRLTSKNEKECNKFITNINVKCIDDSEDSKIKLFYSNKHYLDDTKKLSARTYATLIIEPAINEQQQKKIIKDFNEKLAEYRQKYNSLFLTNYRENCRKRISFDLVYNIVKQLL